MSWALKKRMTAAKTAYELGRLETDDERAERDDRERRAKAIVVCEPGPHGAMGFQNDHATRLRPGFWRGLTMGFLQGLRGDE